MVRDSVGEMERESQGVWIHVGEGRKERDVGRQKDREHFRDLICAKGPVEEREGFVGMVGSVDGSCAGGVEPGGEDVAADAGEIAPGEEGVGSRGEVGGVENVSSDAPRSMPEDKLAAIVVEVSITVFVDGYRGVVARGQEEGITQVEAR